MTDDKHVYVQAGASFNKIDQKTGTIIWRVLNDKGGMYGSAFSSPSFANINGCLKNIINKVKINILKNFNI